MNCIDLSKNNSAVEALEEFKAAYSAFYGPSITADESNRAGEALMAAALVIEHLPDLDPVAAFAKLRVLLWRAEVAYTEEESGLDFAGDSALLERLRSATLAMRQ